MDITEAMKLKGARLQVLISEDTPQGRYQDAIYVNPEDLDKLDEKAITEQVAARVQGWQQFVTEQSSRIPEPPKVEDLQLQVDQLTEQLSRIATQMAEVGTKEDLQALSDKLQEKTDAAKADIATAVSAIDAKPIDIKPDPIKEDPIGISNVEEIGL